MLEFLRDRLASGETFTVTLETRAAEYSDCAVLAVDAVGIVLDDEGQPNCIPWSAVESLAVLGQGD